MPRRPSLAVVKKMGYYGPYVIRFLSIRISTVDRLTVSNRLLEVDIYLNHFGTNVSYYMINVILLL